MSFKVTIIPRYLAIGRDVISNAENLNIGHDVISRAEILCNK